MTLTLSPKWDPNTGSEGRFARENYNTTDATTTKLYYFMKVLLLCKLSTNFSRKFELREILLEVFTTAASLSAYEYPVAAHT